MSPQRVQPEDECMHLMGDHCRPLNCPDCGRFSRHSWDTGGLATQNGWNQHWGGICIKHGEWSDAAA